MKTLIINASPRKNRNTAQLLKKAEEGARDNGSETEYIDLFDLNFTGCRSCLICKLKDSKRCHCYWNDDLSPLLDKIFEADSVIIGSPIYLGDVTSQLIGLLERLQFCMLSYDDYSCYFKGKVNAGVILTMNAGEKTFEKWYHDKMEERFRALRNLNGHFEMIASCDTLQVDDYSKYNMGSFSEELKKERNRMEFPHDLERAYRLGKRLTGE